MGWLYILFLLAFAVFAIIVIKRSAFSTGTLFENTQTLPRQVVARAPPAIPVQRARRPERITAPPAAPLHWAGARDRVRIAGLTIGCPLTYVTDSRKGRFGEEPAAIDLALQVAARPHQPQVRELQYWPRYDALTVGQRRNYLQWLAEGRTRIPPELGYTFLFIYGLERRALVEQTDRRLIFDEVLRLRELYRQQNLGSRSFDPYTGSFLWFLVARHPDVFELARIRRLIGSVGLASDDYLRAALGWFAFGGTALPDWAAYAVAAEMPSAERSVVISRVGDDFKRLFYTRYRERYGLGLVLKLNSNGRGYAYKPASAALSSLQIVGPSPNLRPLAGVTQIWNECIDELRKLSSVRAKEGATELTVAAWDAMPPDLRAGVEHPLTPQVSRLVTEVTDEAGQTIVAAQRLAVATGIACDGRLTPASARRMCEILGHIGYSVEPDARLTGKGYAANECIAVFLSASKDLPDATRYNAAACMMRIGMMIAQADGQVHANEISILTQQIDAAFGLTDDEARRLEALRALLIKTFNDVSSFRAVMRSLPHETRGAVGKLALALAAADGIVTDDELRAIRSCYKNLGFEKDELDEAMRALAPASEPVVSAPEAAVDDAITIQAARPAQAEGERIPPPPPAQAAKPGGLKLDRNAIAAIMKDTREVAEMLAEAMNVSAAEPDQVSPIQPPAPSPTPNPDPAVLAAMAAPPVMTTTDATLPQRYASFYQLLIAKGDWPVNEADALARQHGHLLAGALEALNDWAFEKYGGQLFVEDGDRLVVEQQLLN